MLLKKQDRKKKHMEMLKKYASIAVILVAVVMFTGCFTTDSSIEENVDGNGYITSVNPNGLDGDNIDINYVDGDNPLADVDFRNLNAVDIAFTPVYFGYNTFTIPSAEMEKVNALAEFLIEESSYLILVTGHCDERGTIEYNVSLGEYRAQAIRNVLIQLGIAPERIQTESMGEEMPADPGHNEAAWKLNRRCEFLFFTR